MTIFQQVGSVSFLYRFVALRCNRMGFEIIDCVFFLSSGTVSASALTATGGAASSSTTTGAVIVTGGENGWSQGDRDVFHG